MIFLPGRRNFRPGYTSRAGMQRRHVLGGLLLAFACTPVGRRAEGEPDGQAPEPEPSPPPPPTASEAALAFVDGAEGEAADGVARRPTLVLVIPEDDTARWRRGHVFGELLNHGSEEALAPLAIYEVVCAPMTELRARFPDLPKKGEPWLVLVDRTQRTARARAFADVDLDKLAGVENVDETTIDARMARLAALIRQTADRAMVERLAALEASVLPRPIADELKITTRDGAHARISVATAAAGTLFAWGFHEKPGDDNEWAREELRRVASTSLAAATRDRFTRTRPPKGSSWARSGGCGVRIEGEEENHGFACGMGHVPERSQRFLSFLTGGAPI